MTAQGDEAVRECVARLARGGVVLVADDRDREDEGDLVCAAERMTEEMMAFFLRHGSGIVCTPMSDERADALGLPPMVHRRSDELAESVLAPLGETQRSRLVEAMGVVERLLTAGLVDVTIENPASAAAAFCFRSYFAELDTRFETGFDPTLSNPADVAELVEPRGVLLVGWLRHEPVGCGALKFGNGGHAEIKRMWVTQSVRGLGVGRRLLGELERAARRRGVAALRLETNRALGEAIGLYRSAGYAEMEAFNDERYAHHWFEKHL